MILKGKLTSKTFLFLSRTKLAAKLVVPPPTPARLCNAFTEVKSQSVTEVILVPTSNPLAKSGSFNWKDPLTSFKLKMRRLSVPKDSTNPLAPLYFP